MFSFLKKKQKKQQKQPGRSQIELCKRLGLEITPKMNRGDVSKLLSVSLKQDKYKKIYDEIQRERDKVFEKEDREIYGDKIVDELKKWEQYRDPYKQYFLIFKRGGKVQYEIAEIESAEITGESKYLIKLGILIPKIHKEDFGDYIEWEREITLKPNQVLKIEELAEPIDNSDLETYKAAKRKCQTMASKFTA